MKDSVSDTDAPKPLLLTERQSAALLGISERKFTALRGEDWMPLPVVLGPRLLRWYSHELEASIARMPRQFSPGSEPPQLAKARVTSIELAKRDAFPTGGTAK